MLLVDARLATAESRLRAQLCESLDLRLIVGHALLTPSGAADVPTGRLYAASYCPRARVWWT
jgi:hypothetical protein